MELTNKYGLPQPLVEAAKRDNYSRGRANISVTELIDAPRVHCLRRRHDAEIMTDVSELVWPLLGKAIHHILEVNTPGHLNAEERLFADVNGWVLSGQIDLHKIDGDEVEIEDWKFTSAWAVQKEKIEWEQQLNCYAWLIETVKHLRVRSACIQAIIRDWSRHDAADPSYPQAPMWRVPVKLWTPDERAKYVLDRVRAHQQNQFDFDTGAGAQTCNPTERWQGQDLWAVKRPNGQRAIRVFDSQSDAVAFRDTVKGPAEVEERKGKPTRCVGNYCRVAKWCDQFQAEASKWDSPPKS